MIASGNGAPLDLTFGPYSGGQALYYATLKGTGDEIRRVAYTGNRAPSRGWRSHRPTGPLR